MDFTLKLISQRHIIRTDATNFKVPFTVGQTSSRDVAGKFFLEMQLVMLNVELNCYFYRQTHDDYRGLERAKEAMVDVAQYTNEVKRDSEHLVVIQKVKVRGTLFL